MNAENNIEENVLGMLNTQDSSLKTEALFNLTFEEVDNDVVKTIVQLITEKINQLGMQLQIFLSKIIIPQYRTKWLITSAPQIFLLEILPVKFY